MGFVFKSIFWVGIVLLFMPRDLVSMNTPNVTAQASTKAIIDVAAAGAGFCNSQPALCESALKTSTAGRDILVMAASTLSDRLSAKEPSKHPAQ